MIGQTPNFHLTKDVETDYYDINTVNENLDKIDKALGNTAKFEAAGGTGTTIILTGIDLVDGNSKAFVVTTNNNGAATTINGKPLYKPGTTQYPKLVAGKAVTVWYDEVKGCFFIKASAEGDAVADHVLAGKTFSNDDDTGIIGTMPNNGPGVAEVIELTQDGAEYTVARGFHSGLRKIKAKISGLIASVIKAGATVGGITGTFTSDATAGAGDMLFGKKAGVNGTMVTGSMPNRGSVGVQNLTSEGAEYIIPEGYHNGLGKVKALITGLVASAIKACTTVGGIPGTFTSDATAVDGDVLSGKYYYRNGVKGTGSMTNRGAVNQSLGINDSYTIPAGYHNGSGKVTQSVPTKAAQTYTPGTANQTIAAGQYLSGAQTIAGDPDLVAAKIPEDLNLFGVQGTRKLGSKYAKGGPVAQAERKTYTRNDGTTVFMWSVKVSGLLFTPKTVVIRNLSQAGIENVTVYSELNNGDSSKPLKVICASYAFYNGSGRNSEVLKGDGWVYSGGFELPVWSDYTTNYWEAYGD